MTSLPPILTVEEVAAAVRQDRTTVQRWARDGLIPAIKLPGGQWRFRREDVEAILRGDTPASVAS